MTKAINWGTDNWSLEYYRDSGAYALERSRTFGYSQQAAHGQAWTEAVNLTHAIDYGYTPLAKFRDARNAMISCLIVD